MAELTIDCVTKDFGTGGPAVENLSLTVRKGGFMALLGPSGCGKTTVLRMVAGFEQPTSGSIHLGDRLLANAASCLPPERRNMAMVFQSYALWPHMNVANNVGYPLKVRGVSGGQYREQVASALAVVRLGDLAERRPADLSGGQRQRVALARCLVTSPDVVLLDEPLANLDRHLKTEMEETFREFHQRSGATMVYVTHDQSEAMAMATDIAVMSEGRLQQVAEPAEIYARPEGRLVGGLIGQGVILTLPADDHGGRSFDWQRIRSGLNPTQAASGATPIDLLVRPEDVFIDPDGVECRVEAVLYEGERYALRLSLPDGQALRAFARGLVSVGERLRVVMRAGWRL